MKKILLISILSILCLNSYSQSFIITTSGDTFDCKITKVSEKYLYFDYSVGSQIRSTLIARSKVASFGEVNKSQVKDGDSTSSNTQTKYVESVSGEEYEQAKKIFLPKIERLTIESGYCLYTAPLPEGLSSEYRAHFRKLINAQYLGIGLDFFGQDKGLGIGMAYRNCFSKAESTFEVPYTNLNPFTGQVTRGTTTVKQNDKVITHSILLSFKQRTLLDESGSILYVGLNAGLGILNQDVSFSGPNNAALISSLQGFGPALGVEIGWDISLSELVKLNFNTSYLLNRITRITGGGQSFSVGLDEANNNDTFKLGLGLAFHFD